MTLDAEASRKLRRDLYVRVCRDSGFRMPYDRAAAFVGDMLHTSALDVWIAFSGTDVMQEIASGTHPVCHPPKAANPNP